MPIELVTTDGIFALDGGEWEVTNNIWLVGDDREVMIFDAAHDHEPIAAAVAGRRVAAIVCTHGHNDHINAAVALRDAVDAPVLLHPSDRMLWDVVHPGDSPDRDLEPGSVLAAGGHELGVIHTPGHSPGCCCFHDASDGRVLSGRHAVLRRAGGHRPQLQRRAHHPAQHPRPPAYVAVQHRGAHRPRRQHHHRRGDRAGAGPHVRVGSELRGAVPRTGRSRLGSASRCGAPPVQAPAL